MSLFRFAPTRTTKTSHSRKLVTFRPHEDGVLMMVWVDGVEVASIVMNRHHITSHIYELLKQARHNV